MDVSENVREETEQMNEELLIEALTNDNIDVFRKEFMDLHPYDQATFFLMVNPLQRKNRYFSTFLRKKLVTCLKT